MSDEQVMLLINAGADGPESQDWAAMLLRMYLRWSARRGFLIAKGRKIDRAESGGIKRATLIVTGDGVGRLLRCEHGIHRLVRISPHDPSGRRHTFFADVEITETVCGHMIEPQSWRPRSGMWGNQIRSYVLDPYKMVKDLRTAYQTEDVESVFDGQIDGFIEAAMAAGFPRSSRDDGAATMDAA